MSTKEYGCFFCQGKSRNENGRCPQCQKPINISDQLYNKKITDYTIERVIGRGFYGWTVEGKDPFQSFTLKIIPTHRLSSPMIENKEAKALAACSNPNHRNIARFWRPLSESLKIFDQSVDVLILVFEYIANAMSLNRFINDDNTKLDRGDVIAILAGISSALERLDSKNLWHHDLHDDNILVREIQKDENIPEKFETKVIDFGSVKIKSYKQPEELSRNDYFYLSKHIYTTVHRFEFGKLNKLSPVDRSFARHLRRIAQRLADVDVSRRNYQPTEVTLDLRNSLSKCSTGHQFPTYDEMLSQRKVTLSEPLENTNALSLAPQDVPLLFRDGFGWREQLKKSHPIIVVGPRGCGKTMLFRFVSIESQARPRKEEDKKEITKERLDRLNEIAFLVSCGELRTPFLRSTYKKLQQNDDDNAEDFCREFINAHFVLEVIRALAWIQREQLAEINDPELAPIISTIKEMLQHGNPVSSKTSNLEQLIEIVERHIISLSNMDRPDIYSPTNLCGNDVLVNLSRSLRAINWINGKDIWFLLDDYSVTVIPDFVQRAYNPVVFLLSSDHRVKITSEGDGPVLEDRMGRRYREGRELSKLNLGEIYFRNTEDAGRKFFEEILEARFQEVGVGSLQQFKKMLGEHEYTSGFGEYMQRNKRMGDTRFYGFGLICSLCSGDVSFIIELLHNITHGRWHENYKTIRPIDQDKTTKLFAQRQFADLRRIATYGPHLYDFASRIGNLLREYLEKSKDKNSADERLRIEIEGSGELSDKAKRIHEALLRHSVLIDGGAGKSRKGLPTKRLFFRRLFAPCFPFSPSRKGCIPLTWQIYENWLLEPVQIKRLAEDELPLFQGGQE